MPTLWGAPLRRIEVDHEIPTEGSQAIVATHSPLIAATPGATLIEMGEWGMRKVAYEDLELVQSWRHFLEPRAM